MTERYSDIVTSLNVVEISFSEISKFQLGVDYTDGDPLHVSTDLTLTASLIIDNYSTAPSSSDILLKYNNGTQYVSALDLTNPSISIEISEPVNSLGTSTYGITFTINSAITRSSQGWISSVFNKYFTISVSESFINQIENEGYTTFVNNYSPFYAFDVDLGTLPSPAILSQPQNVIHDSLNGSTFSVQYVYYNGTETGSLWQFSDNYDQDNPETATWSNVNSDDIPGVSSGLSSTATDLYFLLPGVGAGEGSPTFIKPTATLTVPNWTAGRFYRYKYVVV
jgi:hypothetical protein